MEQRAAHRADSGNSSNNRHNAALVPLDGASRLFVKQHVEMFEAMTGWETANSYSVLDDRGQPLYNVMEEPGACMRQCCKRTRSFTLHVCDNCVEEAFEIFVALMDCVPLEDFYAERPPLRGFQIEVEVLLVLLEERQPTLLSNPHVGALLREAVRHSVKPAC